MLLYRYFATHAFETLRDAKLRVSKVSSVNDPFECMYYATGEMTFEKAQAYLASRLDRPEFLELVRKSFPDLVMDSQVRKFFETNKEKAAKFLAENFGFAKEQMMLGRAAVLDSSIRIICFSSQDVVPTNEILLWSHYADKHRGVRIGFAFPEILFTSGRLVPMNYSPERVAFDFSENADSPNSSATLTESLLRKSPAWSYEEEFRLFPTPEKCSKYADASGQVNEFADFPRSIVERVDLGVRFPEEEISMFRDLLKAEYPQTLLYRAKCHRTNYALEYEELC